MSNSTSIGAPVPRERRGKKLSSNRNLRWYEPKIHKILLHLTPPQTVCDECLKSFESLSEAWEHLELAHAITTIVIVFMPYQNFSLRKSSKNICRRSTSCQFGMASTGPLPLPQLKARPVRNCAHKIWIWCEWICFKSWCKTRKKKTLLYWNGSKKAQTKCNSMWK